MDIYNIGTKIDFLGEEGEAMRKLAEDILERSEKAFKSEERTLSVPAGVAVVPTGNDNGHNYPIDDTHVSVGGDEFFQNSKVRRETGNYMTRNPSLLRCPNLGEIEIYLFDLYTNKNESYKAIKAM